ncbi:hypothetical protein HanRHA438_Chr14g0658251 [Helianthus annuus]|nr:hypothetical protein HanRHA438_Chr14g0658251 [Helianthus annuus]
MKQHMQYASEPMSRTPVSGPMPSVHQRAHSVVRCTGSSSSYHCFDYRIEGIGWHCFLTDVFVYE